MSRFRYPVDTDQFQEMAKLEEIIKTEKSRSDSRTFSQIHLFKEGAFIRAYEQSAWLMSRYAAADLQRVPSCCRPLLLRLCLRPGLLRDLLVFHAWRQPRRVRPALIQFGQPERGQRLPQLRLLSPRGAEGECRVIGKTLIYIYVCTRGRFRVGLAPRTYYNQSRGDGILVASHVNGW